VKGSEHYYDPVWCTDAECPKHATPHMHCPFCARSEFYLDPVILRAHYRVKHVDKGIDVYGMYCVTFIHVLEQIYSFDVIYTALFIITQ